MQYFLFITLTLEQFSVIKTLGFFLDMRESLKSFSEDTYVQDITINLNCISSSTTSNPPNCFVQNYHISKAGPPQQCHGLFQLRLQFFTINNK